MRMPQEYAHEELIAYLGRTSGLPSALLDRLVADVLDYFAEPVESAVRRRHADLRRTGLANADIWPVLVCEVSAGRYPARLTERQARRIVYG